MRALGVDAVTTYAPATNFISQIVAQVERLIDKGFAYEIENDGWYFDISKDEDYGKLSGRTAAQAEDGVSRIDDSDAQTEQRRFLPLEIFKARTSRSGTRGSAPDAPAGTLRIPRSPNIISGRNTTSMAARMT